jgi:hypothetical protein
MRWQKRASRVKGHGSMWGKIIALRPCVGGDIKSASRQLPLTAKSAAEAQSRAAHNARPFSNLIDACRRSFTNPLAISGTRIVPVGTALVAGHGSGPCRAIADSVVSANFCGRYGCTKRLLSAIMQHVLKGRTMLMRYDACKAQTLLFLIGFLILDCAVAADPETANKSPGDSKDSTSFSAFVPIAQAKENPLVPVN